MVEIVKYKTYLDYSNESGIFRILYPVRDAIPVLNPYFAILFGFLLVLTVSSYYTYLEITGRTRLLNSLLASSFATTIVSFFFALAQLISPYAVLTFIAITIISYGMLVFYR